MQHVALVRWGSRHTNCEYCNRQRVHQQNLQNL
jgi:hypothetical protein